MSDAYEYQYTKTEEYWGWCDLEIPVPVGFKLYPLGIIWGTVRIPYPCFKTRTRTYTAHACRSSGGNISLIRDNITEIPSKRVALPEPDKLDPGQDKLYAIYRKGLITRHITKNGRLLPAIALECKKDFDPADYDNSGFITVKHSDNFESKIPVSNVRYSEERIPGSNAHKAYMWVPIIAPIKNPGLSNDGFYVVSGSNDNPFYYGGGLALATFALEHIYNVNPYSIEYARRLVLYMLDSEMWEGNGYILRRPGFFNSNRNIGGEPITQGASAEELMGIMLGLMYYLKAEDANHPLKAAAERLRDDILRAVSSGWIGKDYEHPFMNSAHKPSYWVKHFEYPLYAPKEEGSREFWYVNIMTKAFGDTRAGGNWYTPGFVENWFDFQDYMMYLTSMILVLEGNIPESKKEWFAEVYMRDVIKASKTAGPDIEDLEDNLYMAVVAKLANKWLKDNEERDSQFIGDELQSIWGEDWDVYERMIRPLHLPVLTPLGKNWQHNLPFQTNSLSPASWKDHNPEKGIGRWFVWRYSSKSYYWKTAADSDRRWRENFPGWSVFSDSWADFGESVNELEYKQSLDKTYRNAGYIEKELMEGRGSDDNQVEGAGLGLLFLRMLLTHINPQAYPPPYLPNEPRYFVLPYVGAEPLFPQFLYHTCRFSSKHSCHPFKIEGDQDKSLRIIKLDNDAAPFENEFVVCYANDDEKLMLKHGLIKGGGDPAIPHGVYLDQKGRKWRRFDKVSLEQMQNDDGETILVVVERAEGDRVFVPFSGCFLRRKHWLRVSIWKVPPFQVGQDPNLIFLDKWVSDTKHCDSALEVDVTILDRNIIAVLFKTRHDKSRLRLFRVDFSVNKIIPLENILVGGNDPWKVLVSISTAYDNIVVFPLTEAEGRWKVFYLVSMKWNGASLEQVSKVRVPDLADIEGGGYGGMNRLFDIATIKKGSKWFVVAVARKHSKLVIYSWEIKIDGTLVFISEFSTNSAEDYLIGPETSEFGSASIASTTWDDKPGFVIVGKGVGRAVKNKYGNRTWTDEGLKIIFGYLLEDGRATIESSNLYGSGASSAMKMLDVSGLISDGKRTGVVSVNKTKNYGGFLGLWASNYLDLIFWEYRDQFKDHRWNQ